MANVIAIKIRPRKLPAPTAGNLAHNSAMTKASYWLEDGSDNIQSRTFKNHRQLNEVWNRWVKDAEERYSNNPIKKTKLREQALRIEEGMIIIGTDVNADRETLVKIIEDFVKEFEKQNNTKVLHWAFHEHEGHEDMGSQKVNRHIHFLFDNVSNDGDIVRSKWKKTYFSELQTTAYRCALKHLQIERARDTVGKGIRGTHHKQYRREKQQKEKKQHEELITDLQKDNRQLHSISSKLLSDLKKRELKERKEKILQKDITEVRKQLQNQIKRAKYSNFKKKELHKLNKELEKELKALNRSNSLTAKEFIDKISFLEEQIRQMPNKNTIESLYSQTQIVEELGGIEGIEKKIEERNELENQVYTQLNEIKSLKVVNQKNSLRTLELMEEARLSKLDAEEKEKLYNTLKNGLEVFVKEIDKTVTQRKYNLIGFIRNKYNHLIQVLNNLSNDIKNFELRFSQQKKEIETLQEQVGSLHNKNNKLLINNAEIVKELTETKQINKTLEKELEIAKKTKLGTVKRLDPQTTSQNRSYK